MVAFPKEPGNLEPQMLSADHYIRTLPISYPESSDFLVSEWAPGETLGNWNFITAGFLR